VGWRTRKWCELQSFFVVWRSKGLCSERRKTTEVGIFEAFFFASFLLSEQKK
jgi:hypothetical protein